MSSDNVNTPQPFEHDLYSSGLPFSENQHNHLDDDYSSLLGDDSSPLKSVTDSSVENGKSQSSSQKSIVAMLGFKSQLPQERSLLIEGARKSSESSDSDTTPLSQVHGLCFNPSQQSASSNPLDLISSCSDPAMPATPSVHKLSSQTSLPAASQQQSWMQLQSFLHSTVQPTGHPHIHSPTMLSPRFPPVIHEPSTFVAPPPQNIHLRDGEPATPSAVVAALSEYMTRPNRPKPPQGCAPDAVKLFVGNIPKHCTETVLQKVFQCYGLIVEIAVTRNRHSAESKGSAFVWYSTCLEAAQAILALHSRYTFPDAKGDHVRLVTVRPAVKSPKPQPAPLPVPGMFSFDANKQGHLSNFLFNPQATALHNQLWMMYQQPNSFTNTAGRGELTFQGVSVPPLSLSNPAGGGITNASNPMLPSEGYHNPYGAHHKPCHIHPTLNGAYTQGNNGFTSMHSPRPMMSQPTSCNPMFSGFGTLDDEHDQVSLLQAMANMHLANSLTHGSSDDPVSAMSTFLPKPSNVLAGSGVSSVFDTCQLGAATKLDGHGQHLPEFGVANW